MKAVFLRSGLRLFLEDFRVYFDHNLSKWDLWMCKIRQKMSDGFHKEGSKAALVKDALNQKAQRYMSEYGNQILRFAYSYLHSMEEAEDVLQETLLKVLEADPVFENSTHEKAYLLKTAANLSKNHITANKRRETDVLEEDLIALEREDLSFVWEAVKSLPELQREAVHLFYQEGYKTAEIGEILNRKESTIRSDLKRARERLKEILREVYDFG